MIDIAEPKAPERYRYALSTGDLVGQFFSGSVGYTAIKPPKHQNGTIPCFYGNAWHYKPDYRGSKIYEKATGEESVMRDTGPVPDQFTLIEPPPGATWVEEEWQVDPAKVLDALRKVELRKVNAKVDEALNSIISQYPATEILSWGRQESQARAYLAWDASGEGTAPTTPTVDYISSLRGVDKLLLCTKIVTKADQFEAASATLFGLRQKAEDALDACDLVSIKSFEFSLEL